MARPIRIFLWSIPSGSYESLFAISTTAFAFLSSHLNKSNGFIGLPVNQLIQVLYFGSCRNFYVSLLGSCYCNTTACRSSLPWSGWNNSRATFFRAVSFTCPVMTRCWTSGFEM